MRARVERWGHGLGVRIPADLADEAGLRAGSLIDIVVSEGRILLTPTTLDQLLAGVTAANIHRAVGLGTLCRQREVVTRRIAVF